MNEIPWIEDTVEVLDEPELRKLMGSDEAIRIARNKDLGIEDPSVRVNNFVENLPSLFDWFRCHHRDFAWRRTRDPWAVIVAEIMLQRTHAAKVEEVYGTFFDRFPDAEAVVAAERTEVFEIVEPLGFGNRKTKTLKTLAETIIDQHDGAVPNDLETLLEFPRIGPYTARACLCFAYGRPFALVDANVATVAEHAFGYSSSKRAHKDGALYAFLDALIPKHPDAARIFNLSLLDLRVRICAEDSGEEQCPLGLACQYTVGESW